jgi:3-phosphoshikimate 1-carboxyvinyltransferase
MDLMVTRRDGPIDAVVRVPGSKSVANRALVCAMLADGDSTLTGIPDGDDTAVIIDVLGQMGVVSGAGDSWTIRGGRNVTLPGIVDAKLAGTSSRFLTAVAALGSTSTIVDGDAPLRGRPMADLHDALRHLGADIEQLGEPGHLPVAVSRGSLRGGSVSIRGDVSSQFLSALMLIGPLLDGGLSIRVSGELVSRSYVAMTAAVMNDFGAMVRLEETEIHIDEGAYIARRYDVEPDFSSAAFPLVVPVLTPARVRVPGLGRSSLQGDARILDIVTDIGCRVSQDGDDVIVERGEADVLSPVTRSMTDCSDLVPAVAVALSAVAGESRISGVGFIQNKESDRLNDLAREMSECGVSVLADDDGLTVGNVRLIEGATVDTHHDHRLAMALSLMALLQPSVVIRDADVVTKSWPSYFADMHGILSTETYEN